MGQLLMVDGNVAVIVPGLTLMGMARSKSLIARIDKRNIQNDGQQVHWMPDCRGRRTPSLQNLRNLFQEQVVSWGVGNTSIQYHQLKHLEWQ